MTTAPSAPKPIPDKHHGTLTGYTYYKCKCDQCKKAWRDYYNVHGKKEYRCTKCGEYFFRAKPNANTDMSTIKCKPCSFKYRKSRVVS